MTLSEVFHLTLPFFYSYKWKYNLKKYSITPIFQSMALHWAMNGSMVLLVYSLYNPFLLKSYINSPRMSNLHFTHSLANYSLILLHQQNIYQ